MESFPEDNDDAPQNLSVSLLTPAQVSSERDYSIASVALIFAVPALGGALFGFDIGATSYAISQLQEESYSGVVWWEIVGKEPALQGVIVSSVSFGALLGSLVVFSIADAIGRRQELLYAGLFYIVGALLEVGSAYYINSSYAALSLLIIGRLVYGVGVGFAMHGGPTYIAEMSPSSIRGLLVALREVSNVSGVLLGYVAGFSLMHVERGWTYAYLSSIVLSVAMLSLLTQIPRSSRWLLLKGREDEALKSLQFVFDDSVAQEELSRMKQSQQDESPAQEPTQQRSLWHPSYRGPCLAGIGLVALQQMTGQPSILSYATPIFHAAGLADYASVLVAVFKFCTTLSAALMVERFGRKKLLYIGVSFMLVSLTALSLCFGGSGVLSQDVILLSMFIYIGAYQFSFGPISWLIISEVFPLGVRGQAVAVAVQTNFLLNAIVQFGVPILSDLIGMNATFGLFATVSAYSLYFVARHVPETKGLSLEEIEQQFRDDEIHSQERHHSESQLESEPLLEGQTMVPA